MKRLNCIARGIQFDREVVRCSACRLVQFVRSDETCRRCHITFEFSSAVDVIQEVVAAVVSSVVSSETRALAPKQFDIGFACWLVRQQKGLSQKAVAMRMRVPRTYINKIEAGLSEGLLSNTVIRLADALGVTALYLVQVATLDSVKKVLRG